MNATSPLRGVITAMVTPLIDRDRLDRPGLDRLVEHLIAGGVHGIFVLGTTGEAPALSHRLRAEVIEAACGAVAGRVPVIAGITDTCLPEAVQLAGTALRCGAQAVVSSAPYYYGTTQGELLDYFVHLAAEVPLPLLLYNAPRHTRHVLQPALVRQAASIPNIVGLKDSGSDMIYFHSLIELLKGRPDFTLLVGPEELMAEAVLMGGHGGMCAGSNICPWLYVSLYQAAVNGDLALIRRLQSKVMQLRASVYRPEGAESNLLRRMKGALSLLGICGDCMSEPWKALSPEEREEVRTAMIDLELRHEITT